MSTAIPSDTVGPDLQPPGSWRRETALCLSAAAAAMLFAAAFLILDPSYFWRDDFQANYLPRLQEVARAVHHGEFPYLAPGSWLAGDLGGEYQSAIFSPWSLACVSLLFWLGLPLNLTAAGISIVHFGLMAAGACRLARGRGLPAPEAILVAFVSALNGWVWVWGGMTWIVALAGLAWLPWAWWGLERALRPGAGFGAASLAGVLIALLIAASWHYATLMIGLVSAMLLLRAVSSVRWLPACKAMSIAWSMGLGLSAPAWMMLIEYSPWTLRSQIPPLQVDWMWSVPPKGLVGLLLPAFTCDWASFLPLRPHECVELAGAFVPAASIAAALVRLRKSDRRRLAWDLALAALALVMAMGPGLGTFRWSFRWLPLFFMAISLAAGEGLYRLRRIRGGAGFAGLAALVLSVVGLLVGVIEEDHSLTVPIYYGLGTVGASALWACAGGRLGRIVSPWLPPALVLVLLAVQYAAASRYLEFRFLEFPTWSYSRSATQDRGLSPDVTYLGVYGHTDVYGRPEGLQDCIAGNTPLYEGLTFVNGYSPLLLAGPGRLLGFTVVGAIKPEAAERLLHHECGPNGLLELLGVDGLVVIHNSTAGDALRRQGWTLTSTWPTGQVWHRRDRPTPRARIVTDVQWESDREAILRKLTVRGEGPVPLIVESARPPSAELGRAEVSIIREHRNGMELAVENVSPDRPVLVAVSRPWYPGLTARLNGRPVPVYRLDLMIPVVLIPAGSQGTVELEFSPRSARIGMLAATVTLIVMVLGLTGWRQVRSTEFGASVSPLDGREEPQPLSERTEGSLRNWPGLCRPQQWVKNVFVLAPLLFSGAVVHFEARLHALAAFISFCAISSAVYILNDWLDRSADLMHPRKRLRPLAAGRVSSTVAGLLGAGLLAFGLAIGLLLPVTFLVFAGLYMANSLLYCLVLRRRVILDVISIAMGFVLRILAGCSAIGVEPSSWILVCGFSLALTLGFGKRRSELTGCGNAARPALSSYDEKKLDRLLAVSTAITLLTYILYTVAPETVAIHGTYRLVYSVPLVAYGLFRYLAKAKTGNHDGPTEILLSDRVFLVTGLAWVVVVCVVLYWPGT